MQKDDPLQIAVRDGNTPVTRVFEFIGPITLPNIFAFQNTLRTGDRPQMAILDFSQVPYMDSAGMGAVINYFTHCRRSEIRMIVSGVNNRVSELFKMTGVDTVIPMTASVEEAEARG